MIYPLGATNCNCGYFDCTLWRIHRLSTVSLFFFLFSSIKGLLNTPTLPLFHCLNKDLWYHTLTQEQTSTCQPRPDGLGEGWHVPPEQTGAFVYFHLSELRILWWLIGFSSLVSKHLLHVHLDQHLFIIKNWTLSHLLNSALSGETKVSSFFRRYLFFSFMDTF